ncbi:unnamed protein product [Gongylonema pulchrum]|uniref:Guanine nucleotide exchange factor MSS4 homolog n=1 Tax=Gongylonema pulchrum TaxID=637853 RepID=A0A183EE79_9BILA|nr:unnamed protein product [Gongylonema pulchrum]
MLAEEISGKLSGWAGRKRGNHDLWYVEKMFDFENIGFTHASNGIKYLVCANCEEGPVGYVCPTTKAHFVAVCRVVSSSVEEPLDLVRLSLDERIYIKMRNDRELMRFVLTYRNCRRCDDFP